MRELQFYFVNLLIKCKALLELYKTYAKLLEEATCDASDSVSWNKFNTNEDCAIKKFIHAVI